MTTNVTINGVEFSRLCECGRFVSVDDLFAVNPAFKELAHVRCAYTKFEYTPGADDKVEVETVRVRVNGHSYDL